MFYITNDKLADILAARVEHANKEAEALELLAKRATSEPKPSAIGLPAKGNAHTVEARRWRREAFQAQTLADSIHGRYDGLTLSLKQLEWINKHKAPPEVQEQINYECPF